MNPLRAPSKPKKDTPPVGQSSTGVPPGEASSITPSKPHSNVPSRSKPHSGTPNTDNTSETTPHRPDSNKLSRSRSRWGTPADKHSPGKSAGKVRSVIPPSQTNTNTPLKVPQSGNRLADISSDRGRPYNPQEKSIISSDQLIRNIPKDNRPPVKRDFGIPPGQRAYVPLAKSPATPKIGQLVKGIPSQEPKVGAVANPCAPPGNLHAQSTTGIPRRKVRSSSSKRKIYEDPNARPWKLFKWTMSTHKLKKISILLIIAGVMLIALAIVGTMGITLLRVHT